MCQQACAPSPHLQHADCAAPRQHRHACHSEGEGRDGDAAVAPRRIEWSRARVASINEWQIGSDGTRGCQLSLEPGRRQYRRERRGALRHGSPLDEAGSGEAAARDRIQWGG